MNQILKVKITPKGPGMVSLLVWGKAPNGQIFSCQTANCAVAEIPEKMDAIVSAVDFSNYPFDNPGAMPGAGSV